jgi:hypothetical protein
LSQNFSLLQWMCMHSWYNFMTSGRYRNCLFIATCNPSQNCIYFLLPFVLIMFTHHNPNSLNRQMPSPVLELRIQNSIVDNCLSKVEYIFMRIVILYGDFNHRIWTCSIQPYKLKDNNCTQKKDLAFHLGERVNDYKCHTKYFNVWESKLIRIRRVDIILAL